MPDIKNAWNNFRKNAPDKQVSQKDQRYNSRLKIGRYNNLVIESRSDYGLYLSFDEERILLPNKYVPDNFNIGDILKVFVYTDSEDRLVATTLKPAGIVGDFVFLKA